MARKSSGIPQAAWGDDSLSDFEKGNAKAPSYKNSHNYYQFSKSMPTMTGILGKSEYVGVPQAEEMYTDDEAVHPYSADEFAAEDPHSKGRALKTGRQRKKLAARSKGSEFRTNRKKKRVYFCCISSEIDTQKMIDELFEGPATYGKWQHRVYTDVLHLYKDDQPVSSKIAITNNTAATHTVDDIARDNSYERRFLEGEVQFQKGRTYSAMSETEGYTSYPEDTALPTSKEPEFRISNPGAQEIFIFDFGAVVLWGVPRGEEGGLLKTIRKYASKGMVGQEEFSSGEDDMAFIMSPDATGITIQNDVIELPLNSEPKQRLSVSFAIAQSSVLAIFEARIEKKVEEYKYIPEALAAHGKIHLTELQLGMMIGEVFVIRHDVNLHTEILDTPDFFWKEEYYETHYQMVMSYLEMSSRTEILNKRLDMLRELLDVLQQLMESSHAVKLEWIVIWLIVAEVVLQVLKTVGY